MHPELAKCPPREQTNTNSAATGLARDVQIYPQDANP
jgi:hypothetical protein